MNTLPRLALKLCDGVVIHSLVGALKPGDIPADVRVKCIDTLVDNYFVKDFCHPIRLSSGHALCRSQGGIAACDFPSELRYQ